MKYSKLKKYFNLNFIKYIFFSIFVFSIQSFADGTVTVGNGGVGTVPAGLISTTSGVHSDSSEINKDSLIVIGEAGDGQGLPMFYGVPESQVVIIQCKSDSDHIALFASCDQIYMGYLNTAIKVPDGLLLVQFSNSSAFYFKKSNEALKIKLGKIQFNNTTARAKNVTVQRDFSRAMNLLEYKYSNTDELIKFWLEKYGSPLLIEEYLNKQICNGNSVPDLCNKLREIMNKELKNGKVDFENVRDLFNLMFKVTDTYISYVNPECSSDGKCGHSSMTGSVLIAESTAFNFVSILPGTYEVRWVYEGSDKNGDTTVVMKDVKIEENQTETVGQ